MSVDLITPHTIVMGISPMENSQKVTDDNIRLIVTKYYTPTITESSKGVVVTFQPKGHSGPEAIVWFENAKRGFQRKPVSMNQWMMVDCDLKGIHELLHKYFSLSEGDFNVTRLTLSQIAHEVVRELYSNPKIPD